MPTANNPPADLSAVVARNGHVLVFQGLHHQALFIPREHVSRFLENPRQAAMLVIPPFAATALACYTAMEEGFTISLTQDLSLGTDFSFVITTARGSKITYLSDCAAVAGPRSLAAQGINIAITPMAVVAVGATGANPVLSTVARIPYPQTPNYAMRFAADPNIIKETVEDALHRSHEKQRHAN